MKRRNESYEVSEAKRFVVEYQELSDDQLGQVLFCVIDISKLLVFRLVSRRHCEQLKEQWAHKMLEELSESYTDATRSATWRQIGILYHLESSLPQHLFKFFRGCLEIQRCFRFDNVGLWTDTPRGWGLLNRFEENPQIPRFLAWRLTGAARVLPGSVSGLNGREFALDAHCTAMPFEMFMQAFSVLVTQGNLPPSTVSEIIYTLALLGYPRTQIAILVELAEQCDNWTRGQEPPAFSYSVDLICIATKRFLDLPAQYVEHIDVLLPQFSDRLLDLPFRRLFPSDLLRYHEPLVSYLLLNPKLDITNRGRFLARLGLETKFPSEMLDRIHPPYAVLSADGMPMFGFHSSVVLGAVTRRPEFLQDFRLHAKIFSALASVPDASRRSELTTMLVKGTGPDPLPLFERLFKSYSNQKALDDAVRLVDYYSGHHEDAFARADWEWLADEQNFLVIMESWYNQAACRIGTLPTYCLVFRQRFFANVTATPNYLIQLLCKEGQPYSDNFRLALQTMQTPPVAQEDLPSSIYDSDILMDF